MATFGIEARLVHVPNNSCSVFQPSQVRLGPKHFRVTHKRCEYRFVGYVQRSQVGKMFEIDALLRGDLRKR